MKHFVPVRIFLFTAVLLYSVATAFSATDAPGNISRGISAEGSCAVIGTSAEQSQLIALQRARAAAIEQAAGVHVSSTTLVTDFMLTLDSIKTYSRGFIVSEQVEWLPLGQYQKDRSTAPIPEYRVRISADVRMPEQKVKPLGLQARTSATVYRNGEPAWVEVKTSRPARIGIFNITADDRVVLVFPNQHDHANFVRRGEPLHYPDKKSTAELEMQVLPGHSRDAEAFFIVALDEKYPVQLEDRFTPLQSLPLAEFFARYDEFADYGEDSVLAYAIVGK